MKSEIDMAIEMELPISPTEERYMRKYERETGKHAIWRSFGTKQFLDWMKKKGYPLRERLRK